MAFSEYEKYFLEALRRRNAERRAQDAADAGVEWLSFPEAVHLVLPVLFGKDWVGLASEQEHAILNSGDESHPDWARYAGLKRLREEQIARVERWLLVNGLIEDRRGARHVNATPLRAELDNERRRADSASSEPGRGSGWRESPTDQPAGWQHWHNRLTAELWQAVALSLDIEPETLSGLDFRPNRIGGAFDNCRDEFRRRLAIACDHAEHGALRIEEPAAAVELTVVSLPKFARLAASQEWKLHDLFPRQPVPVAELPGALIPLGALVEFDTPLANVIETAWQAGGITLWGRPKGRSMQGPIEQYQGLVIQWMGGPPKGQYYAEAHAHPAEFGAGYHEHEWEDLAIPRSDFERLLKSQVISEALPEAKSRAFRTRQILRFRRCQIRRLRWISLADIADWIATERGAHDRRDESLRAQGYDDLLKATLVGEFEVNRRSHVLYLTPDKGEGARLTADLLRQMHDFYSGTTTVNDEVLSRCWMPRALAQKWFKRRDIPWPSRFDPIDAGSVYTSQDGLERDAPPDTAQNGAIPISEKPRSRSAPLGRRGRKAGSGTTDDATHLHAMLRLLATGQANSVNHAAGKVAHTISAASQSRTADIARLRRKFAKVYGTEPPPGKTWADLKPN